LSQTVSNVFKKYTHILIRTLTKMPFYGVDFVSFKAADYVGQKLN